MAERPLKNTYDNREIYLKVGADALRPDFAAISGSLPDKMRFGIGFTTRGKRGKAMGEAHVRENSADGTVEIIISPQIAAPPLVVKELLIQLVQVAAHNNPKRKMRDIALAIGFTGPKRQMEMTPRLAERVNALAEQLGPYPHAVLTVSGLTIEPETKVLGAPPKQKARMLKLVCDGRSADKPCQFKARAAASLTHLVACREHGGSAIRLADQPPSGMAEAAE